MFAHLRESIRYRFENFMSKGGKAIFISLFVLFMFCLGLAVAVRWTVLAVFPEMDIFQSFSEHVWAIFLTMTDPGNMGVDTDSGAALKVSAVVSGVLGVIIFSMLIAFITTSLDGMIYEFRKGRSRVLEKGQTLILNWNERTLDILRELIIANESESKASVVILAEREKEEMDDEISTFIANTKTTKVVARKGNTSTIANLRRISASSAKSAIILATCSDQASEDEKRVSDAKAIKTILALQGCQEGKNNLAIVVELLLAESRKLLETFEDPLITCIDTWDILGKILVQTSRTSGLAVVYNEILSFDGCELYFREADWNGVTFGEMLYHFPDGIPMGIRHVDGRLEVRPGAGTVMEKGDEVLIVADDDSTIDFQSAPIVQPKDFPFEMQRVDKGLERELILGWHSIASIAVREYAEYLLEGSSIEIVVHRPSEKTRKEIAALAAFHPDLQITLKESNPLDLDQLRALSPFDYDNVIILSQDEDWNPEKTDSETLVILLLLRKIARDGKVDIRRSKIITQILDSENQELISQTNVNDFIISNKLITMIFAQLSEEPRIKEIYDDIFQEDGSEIYLKPVELYFKELPVTLRFCDMIGQAMKRDEEICLGYRLEAHATEAEHNFGVKLNPAKDQQVTLNVGDTLVVLAEDEL
ncbi:MAG: hypothetical protein JRF33_26475 [Deltaproteobacteria bacterium]|nr:hypothetical protein [Deltaproteobacteria bacterium]